VALGRVLIKTMGGQPGTYLEEENTVLRRVETPGRGEKNKNKKKNNVKQKINERKRGKGNREKEHQKVGRETGRARDTQGTERRRGELGPLLFQSHTLAKTPGLKCSVGYLFGLLVCTWITRSVTRLHAVGQPS
jgi:hypothetical protein